MRPWIVVWMVGLSATFTGGALAYPVKVTGSRATPDTEQMLSRSLGYPWKGRLAHGVRLRESKHVRLVHAYRERANHWGSTELVHLIDGASRVVARAHGPGRLAVGELSSRYGGKISGHRSHQNGRDVDIGFYLREGKRVVPWPSFVYLRRSGSRRVGMDGRLLVFDRERNWTFVAHLASDAPVPVQHLFVDNSIRRILLRHARTIGEDPTIIERAARMMVPAGGEATPHTDHFHVRIYCPPRDRPRCRDQGPFWPWLADLHERTPVAGR
ncbi:MAG: penicillin-insensitive murein endopeptidase [Myxococcales bacterium]|nr:penicillin-insensitive murein endopeptidase [Myxococcales bacterium]